MNLSENITTVITIAKEAGAFIREERRKFSYEKVENKATNDLVSYVDKTAEEMIVSKLRKAFPAHGYIAEENRELEKKDYNWIIDPLDGTTNFVHGIPCYAVSIGLEHKGEILLGVVYEVANDECYYAWSGGGAFLDGKKINVTQTAKLKDSLIATGFPVNKFDKMTAVLNCLDHFMRNTHGVRRIGSAASDLCFLASGRVDAFYEYNLNPWDVAAGIIIVKEAGGKVSDFSFGNDHLFGRQIMAANTALFEEFGNVIRKNFIG
ncbi:MAG TPA: inositol monophosphatase family protein [Bacteroidia bacterium]